MKVLLLNGSERGERSSSLKVARAFVNGIKKYCGDDFELVEVDLGKKKISHCLGCLCCWKTTKGECVIHDDMDLPVAEIRIRKNGGSGGHNGIKSIINCMNSQEFKRIRIGIDHPEDDTIEFVLGKFKANEGKMVQEVMDKAPNIIDDLIINGIDYIMNHYNN